MQHRLENLFAVSNSGSGNEIVQRLKDYVDLIADDHHHGHAEEDHILIVSGKDRKNCPDSKSWDVDHSSRDDVAIDVHDESMHEEEDCT